MIPASIGPVGDQLLVISNYSALKGDQIDDIEIGHHYE